MKFERIKCATREEWLEQRGHGLGGSDAAAIIGANPWKTNEQLWEEKTGITEALEISNLESVQFGTQAESSIRRMFRLDFPEYTLYYRDNELLRSKEYPYLQASLDGELTDRNGRRGILEVKTTTINHSMQREQWNEQVPQNYYCQILHYLIVTGYEFAILKARLKSIWAAGETRISIKHYFFERSDCIEDMNYLLNAEKTFWNQVQTQTRPALLLPAI